MSFLNFFLAVSIKRRETKLVLLISVAPEPSIAPTVEPTDLTLLQARMENQ